MSMSGGSQGSSQTTRPLTPQEMQGYYNQAMSNLSTVMPNGSAYVAPMQQTLTGGDYDRLQSDTLKGYTAGLDYAKSKDIEGVNQNLANRGIWSSGLADKAVQDREVAFAPQYAAAGAQSTQAGLTAKQAELTQGNQMAMANAAAKNEAAWRPADYLGQLWGMGKASSSTGSSYGAQGGFSI